MEQTTWDVLFTSTASSTGKPITIHCEVSNMRPSIDSIRRASIVERDNADAHADNDLAKMGYKAELPRHLSMMSIFGLYEINHSGCRLSD